MPKITGALSLCCWDKADEVGEATVGLGVGDEFGGSVIEGIEVVPLVFGSSFCLPETVELAGTISCPTRAILKALYMLIMLAGGLATSVLVVGIEMF